MKTFHCDDEDDTGVDAGESREKYDSEKVILPLLRHSRLALRDLHTSARRSKRANSSLSIFTRSWAEYVEEMAVNPTMSAYRMLRIGREESVSNDWPRLFCLRCTRDALCDTRK